MDGLTPVIDMNGGNNGFGGSTLGAFAGALFGSWFGDGFGGRGGYAYNNAGCQSTAVLDAVNGVANAVNNANTANIQGFSGLNTVVMGSANATQREIYDLHNATNQGFAGLNTSILVSNKDLVKEIADCCCQTQKTIIEQGCQTRELINALNHQTTRDELAKAQAKIAQCDTLAAVDAKINASANQVISHVKMFIDNVK